MSVDSSPTPTVVSCVILPPDKDAKEYQSRVLAQMSDGSDEVVLSFYEDELSFTADEFIGLDKAQVGALFHKKDVAYLQAP